MSTHKIRTAAIGAASFFAQGLLVVTIFSTLIQLAAMPTGAAAVGGPRSAEAKQVNVDHAMASTPGSLSENQATLEQAPPPSATNGDTVPMNQATSAARRVAPSRDFSRPSELSQPLT